MDDLELLHHFTTETCFTLSDRPESHALWQVTVPQLAFQHDFLMRGILAIAALHLSFHGGAKHDHWANLAIQQQDTALSAFRSLVNNMDETNCDAFFALSSLIVVYGFEFPKTADSLGLFNLSGEHSDEWLSLIRGVNSIIISLWPSIKSGKLSGLLHDHARVPSQMQIPEVLETQLQDLNHLCEQVPGDEESVKTYKIAIGVLADCFERMANKQLYECEVSLAFLWPVMVPQEFISKLGHREPEAFIVLSFYCVILYQLDNYWWMNGWAVHIIRNIYRQLNKKYQVWLRWPASMVGLGEEALAEGPLPDSEEKVQISDDMDATTDKVESRVQKDPANGIEEATNAKSNDT